MQATTRCAPDSCAIAASEETPYTGSPRATAKPCASPHAIRRPVNDPGPAPYATASSAAGVRPASASSRSSIGSASSEWRLPARCSSEQISPPSYNATEHHSLDVSNATNRMADSIYSLP